MDGRTSIKEEVLEEGITNEGGFHLETVFENDTTISQHYLEVDNKTNIRELNISEGSLVNDREICSVDCKRACENDPKIHIKKEFDILYTGQQSNYVNDSEIESKISIKEEPDNLDAGLANDDVCFSTNRHKNDTVTYITHFEANNTETKEQAFHSDINFENKERCSSLDVKKITEEFVSYNESGEACFETVSTETERQSVVLASDPLQQSENKDRKAEDLESRESPRLYVEAVWAETPQEITGISVIQKTVNIHSLDKLDNSEDVMSGSYAKYRVLSNERNVQHESLTEMCINKSALKSHSLMHENRNVFKCDVCPKSFNVLRTWKKHILTHEGKRPYECSVCKKSFTYLTNLKKHCLIHEGKKPHECKICKKTFTQLSNLKTHSLIHDGKKPHECNFCKKSFTHKKTLKNHSLIHEGKKPHECNICKKSFTQLSGLKSHSLMHKEKKPHKCNFCEKNFARQATLRNHIMVHEGRTPHECSVCKKSFVLLSTLKYHSLTHGGQRPFECNICKKTFTWLSTLKTHSLIHGGKKQHECNVCKKRFIRISDLKRHSSIH